MSSDERIGSSARQRLAAELAVHGGRIALEYFHRAKHDESGDAEIRQRVAARIAATFPDDAVVGAEPGQPGGRSHALHAWVVAPGGAAHSGGLGLPGFAVSIGVLRSGLPFVGAVYDPLARWLFTACAGRGAWLNERPLQATAPVDYSRMRVFAVDELCPPAPPDGYFWRQVRAEFLAWAGVDAGRCAPFRVDDRDLAAMCEAYEARIADAGGLDLVMLGLGPNGHIASNEPPADFASRTRPVRLLASTVEHILTDDVIQGAVGDAAVTLGVATIMAAREVVVLVSGPGKREALGRLLDGPITPELPASVLRRHPACTVLADRDARPD